MENQLFIPEKIKVGFQKREDTYTKKLAYVIYYDAKGVLRKETSWEGWRDKNIDPVEIENVPYSGFTLNKDVQRSSEWFGGGRSMIRVYDDRGIEFEITCDNLLFILMTTDCLKRGLQGNFVYSWYGKELILLPVQCEEYETSVKFTKLQKDNVPAKEMKPGIVYLNKRQETLIYLGKFKWYEFDYDYKEHYVDSKKNSCQRRKSTFKNKFIFIKTDSTGKQEIVNLSDTKTIAKSISNDVVDNYAELLELFAKSKNSSPIISFKTEKFDVNEYDESKPYYYYQNCFQQLEENYLKKINISSYKNNVQENGKWISKFIGYMIHETYNNYEINGNELLVSSISHRSNYLVNPNTKYSDYNKHVFSFKELLAMKFLSLKAVYENGLEEEIY